MIHQCRILILPRLICLGWSGTEIYNGAVAFLQLEPSFRSRFSKYPEPKRGRYRPWFAQNRCQRGIQATVQQDPKPKNGWKSGYRPRSKETRCQKGINGFGSSNNRSHRVYLGFEIPEPFFLLAPALHRVPLFVALSRAVSLSLSLSFVTDNGVNRISSNNDDCIAFALDLSLLLHDLRSTVAIASEYSASSSTATTFCNPASAS